jgi:4-hydroxybenzoate polyprenyltransferase
MTTMHRSRWFLPLFSVALGIACFVALWIGGEEGSAWFSLALMSVAALAFLVGGRFDMVRGLRGDGRDEYWARIDVHATALAGHVVIATIIVMCLWEWAHGRDGSPYVALGAITGVAYVVALTALRIRS